MSKKPTDFKKGRVTVHLNEEDIDFLIKEWDRLFEGNTDFQKERWSTIIYDLSSALFQKTKTR